MLTILNQNWAGRGLVGTSGGWSCRQRKTRNRKTPLTLSFQAQSPNPEVNTVTSSSLAFPSSLCCQLSDGCYSPGISRGSHETSALLWFDTGHHFLLYLLPSSCQQAIQDLNSISCRYPYIPRATDADLLPICTLVLSIHQPPTCYAFEKLLLKASTLIWAAKHGWKHSSSSPQDALGSEYEPTWMRM